MKRSGMVVGAHGGSGGEVGPLHRTSCGSPPRPGEDLKKPPHSAASLNWTPRTSSSEQRCIVGLARQMALVRKKSAIG